MGIVPKGWTQHIYIYIYIHIFFFLKSLPRICCGQSEGVFLILILVSISFPKRLYRIYITHCHRKKATSPHHQTSFLFGISGISPPCNKQHGTSEWYFDASGPSGIMMNCGFLNMLLHGQYFGYASHSTKPRKTRHPCHFAQGTTGPRRHMRSNIKGCSAFDHWLDHPAAINRFININMY